MPLESEPKSDYVRKFQVAILDNSALTDNLTDNEAKIYLDWAHRVAEKVALPIQNEADAEEKRDALMKLLRVMSRLVTHRQEKDNAWFLSMLEKLSTLQISLINSGLTEQQCQRVTSLYDSDNATLLQHLTKLLLESIVEEAPDKGIIPSLAAKVKAYRPPDTDIKPFQAPKRDIKTFAPPKRDISSRPPKPDDEQSDY